MTNQDVSGDVPNESKSAYDKIKYWMRRDTVWRRNCINLIASENVVSPAVRAALVSDFEGRYAEGWPAKRYYQGTWMFDEIEIIGQELTKRLFGCDYADLSPVSGAVANLGCLLGMTGPGDTIMSLSLQHGAHITQTDIAAAGVLGLKSVYLPFDEEAMNIDIKRSQELIRKTKPRLVIVAGSVYLFPHPVAELKEACEKVGAHMMYDGAHVAGLIAGKAFPNPFEKGCDVVTFSSHKTFPGPQGGMMLYTDKLEERWRKRLKMATFPRLMSSHHLHHVVGKAIAAAEMLEFGEDYAKQTVKNAKTLAAALYGEGIQVLGKDNGFTRSHQVLVDVSDYGGGKGNAEKLEKANIIVSKQVLPNETRDDVDNPSGMRLGTPELTRLGMREKEMDKIARFISRVVVDKEDPENVSMDVMSFKKKFNKVKYCFEPGEAYDNIKKFI
jgi:glycine hydroxymethyltransferase